MSAPCDRCGDRPATEPVVVSVGGVMADRATVCEACEAVL